MSIWRSKRRTPNFKFKDAMREASREWARMKRNPGSKKRTRSRGGSDEAAAMPEASEAA